MGLKWRKFRLLMWKNWLIFYRAPCRIIFIVLFPVLCSLFAKIGRTIAETDHHLEMSYNNFCTFPIKGPPCDSEEKPESFLAFQNYRNFCVLYSPAAPAADRIMTYFKSAFSDVRRMQNSHELNIKAFIQGNPNLFAAVEFDESISEGQNSLPDNVKITIRMPTFLRYNESLTWRTDTFLPKSFTLGPREPEAMTCAFPNYHIEGFLALQHFITMMVIAEKKKVPPPKNPEDPNDWKEVASKLTSWKVPFIYMQRYPNAEYYEDTYLTRFKFIIPYLVLIGFLTPFTVTVYMITLEKEKQLKETMKIIGVSNWLHWTSWFLTMLVIFAIVAFLVTVILKAHVSGDYPMIDLTSGLTLYVFVICYCCSLFTYAFAVSVLFSTTTMAVILSIAFFFLATVPVFVVAHGFEMMLPLFPNAAFCYGLGAIMDLEILGLGLQIKNLFKTVIPGTLFTPGTIMLMLLVDSLLFMLIALYIEAIRPGKYGVGKYWFFLCMPKFWFREKKVNVFFRRLGQYRQKLKENTENGNYSQRPEGVVQNSGEFFEKEPTGKIGVSAKNLGTFFGTEEAVKGLTLNIFEGQTTVLVGHTGAGKTTTLMILTGMYPSTSGSATVNGYNIRTEIDGVRSSLGLCPQHNIIFNELTVKEHLYFFSSLKGLDPKATNEEIIKILDLLNLRGKRSKLAKKLSPSLKRKLSVGIAFCGKPKVVILDEPSTGMDVAAQRTLWDLIVTQKTSKTVLITTSSMKEADLLGDRIAIMVKGELKCCGSSNFLKKKYGTGYYLIIEKGPNCDPSNITALLRKHIPNTSIIRNTGTELTYSMPEDQTNLFELTLKELESRSKELAIERFVMSLTTLEEVFKKVRIESNGKQHNTTEPLDYIQNTPTVSHTGNIGSVYATGCTLTKNQYKAMFIKRYICTRGSWVLMLTAFLIPTIFTGFGLISLTAPSAARALPPITLSLDSLDDPVILYQMEQVKPPLIYALEKAYKTKRVDDIDKYTRRLSATDPGKLKLKHMAGLNVYEAQTKSFIFTFPQVVVVWFGNDPFHAPAISLGVALNAIYKMALDCDSCNLQFVNYPLPVAAASKVKNANKTEESAKLMHMFLAFGLFFTSCLFIFPIVQERACEAKYQQFVAGLKVYVYWTAIFIWDLMIWSVIVLVVEISLFLIFQLEGYRSFEELGRLYLLMLLLGWALLPLCYFFGFMFTSTTSALIWCVGYHYFFGYTADSAYKFLTNDLNISVADIVCLWFPHYAFTVGLENLYHMAKIEGVCQKVQESCHASQEMFEQCSKDNSAIIMACSHLERNYFKFKSPGIGAVCMMMFINGLVTFLLIILVDMRFFSSLKSIFYVFCCRLKPIKNELEDDDVARERQKIQTTSIKTLTNNNMIVVKDMTKFFGPKLVVNNVCLTIEKSECFGLLGEKGAGKSTMIKMMNGDISMTSGQAWVAGYSVKRNMKDVQRYIGYCPQNDAILGALTPRQTLLIFALIRGVKPESMRSTIKTLAKEFDFEAYLDTPIKHICGGNKRKVSTAVALMGNPYVIYLDEPTAGIDPTTKRYLVNNLAKIRASGKCIVMTSHNLEDAEELCSRIAIMVNGRLQCLGSVQELKEKFAKGCFITIKIRRVERRVQLEEPSAIPSTIQLETYMAEILPTAVLMYEHADTLIFKLEDPSMPWSTLFGIMENLKRRAHLNIDNYSIIQNGLEQIFVSVLSTLKMRRNK